MVLFTLPFIFSFFFVGVGGEGRGNTFREKQEIKCVEAGSAVSSHMLSKFKRNSPVTNVAKGGCELGVGRSCKIL